MVRLIIIWNKTIYVYKGPSGDNNGVASAIPVSIWFDFFIPLPFNKYEYKYLEN